MKLLIKPRASGKTTGLIYTSEATGYPIVTNSKITANYIKEQAKEMNCDIPDPITVNDIHSGIGLPSDANILFDNVETILKDALNYYLGANVVCATMSSPEKKNIEETNAELNKTSIEGEN